LRRLREAITCVPRVKSFAATKKTSSRPRMRPDPCPTDATIPEPFLLARPRPCESGPDIQRTVREPQRSQNACEAARRIALRFRDATEGRQLFHILASNNPDRPAR